jgi:hypothetical protein
VWATQLKHSLDHWRTPHDIVEVSPVADRWEGETLRKASQLQDAMRRHPDKVIVFVDVDCIVQGDISELANLSGDVAVRMRARVRRRGLHNGRYTMHANTGTIVVKPTDGARAFVQKWVEHSEAARFGDVDQTSFLTAMEASPDTSFQPLAWQWSATMQRPGLITHDQASKQTRKINWLDRQVNRFLDCGRGRAHV